MKNIKLDIQRYKNLIGDESDFRFKDYLKILSPRLIPNVLFRTSYYLKKKDLRNYQSFFLS